MEKLSLVLMSYPNLFKNLKILRLEKCVGPAEINVGHADRCPSGFEYGRSSRGDTTICMRPKGCQPRTTIAKVSKCSNPECNQKISIKDEDLAQEVNPKVFKENSDQKNRLRVERERLESEINKKTPSKEASGKILSDFNKEKSKKFSDNDYKQAVIDEQRKDLVRDTKASLLQLALKGQFFANCCGDSTCRKDLYDSYKINLAPSEHKEHPVK